MIEINKIYNSDAFQILPTLQPSTFDLIVCDGPYGVTNKNWDKILNIQEFNLNLIKIFSILLKPGGALYLFGKPNCIDFIDYRPYLTLASKIIWYQPSRLSQGRINYTNNYDLICYFIKGKKPKTFNLNSIRIPQLVELQHRKRCEQVPSVLHGKFKKTKYNKNGKNPGDVWGDIKQLTYKSKELVNKKALNTIQKPEALIERIIKASSNENDLILDPFCGTGTCPAICKKLNRNFLAIEINKELFNLATERLEKISKL